MQKLRSAAFVVAVLCVQLTHARTLTDADLAGGAEPQPGDEIILRDVSRLTPPSALAKTSQKGRWWLRPYKDENGQEHTMLMTVERDMDQPETCIVPAVTLPLKLDGWYAVWIATYRGTYGGGLDVRLSGDDCFVHMDPQQIALHDQAPEQKVGAIIEINYKPAADLTGQDLVFQQPFGTYESFHWGFCEASLAYVRLVRLSDAEVAAFKKDMADDARRIVAFDDDFFSRFWMWNGKNAHAVLRIMESFRHHDMAFYGMNMGAMTASRYPTPHTDYAQSHFGRLGDKRVNATFNALVAKQIDPVALAVERAHTYGFKLMPTWRMSAPYHRGEQHKKLSAYRIKGNVRLDFSKEPVQAYYTKVFRYYLETYDVDGFIMDFTRHCIHFHPSEPNKVEHMNRFCGRVRKMVDEVSAKKGRKLLLCATFGDPPYVSGFQRHHFKINVPRAERLAIQGIDPEAWARHGFFDILMPEGRCIPRIIEAVKGSQTQCYPRWTYTNFIFADRVGKNIHDPKPSEDKKDRHVNPHLGPLDYEAGWLKLREMGADGLYLFNNPKGWQTLRRMGHLDEVRRRVKAGRVHALIERDTITFVDQAK